MSEHLPPHASIPSADRQTHYTLLRAHRRLIDVAHTAYREQRHGLTEVDDTGPICFGASNEQHRVEIEVSNPAHIARDGLRDRITLWRYRRRPGGSCKAEVYTAGQQPLTLNLSIIPTSPPTESRLLYGSVPWPDIAPPGTHRDVVDALYERELGLHRGPNLLPDSPENVDRIRQGVAAVAHVARDPKTTIAFGRLHASAITGRCAQKLAHAALRWQPASQKGPWSSTYKPAVPTRLRMITDTAGNDLTVTYHNAGTTMLLEPGPGQSDLPPAVSMESNIRHHPASNSSIIRLRQGQLALPLERPQRHAVAVLTYDLLLRGEFLAQASG